MKRILLSLILLSVPHINSTILVQGNTAIGPNSFTVPITALAYDIATGSLYVGLAGGNTFALSKVLRPLSSGQPTFIPIAPDGHPTNGAVIEFLTLATNQGNTNPNLALVIQADGGPFQQSVITAAVSSTGNPTAQSLVLNDATGVSETAGIVGIAANNENIFAAVRPNSGDFPNTDSGIALIEIENPLALEIQDATTGLAGNRAQPFDVNQPEIQIVNPPTAIENTVDMHWDDQLQRLYIGLRLTTAGTAGDGAKGVVVDRLSSGILVLESFLPDAALVNGETDKIVAAKQAANALDIDIFKLRTMHTSTGASYLIVNGGVLDPTTTNSQGNMVYALPLVDVDDPTNATQGVLANKNLFNATTHRFEVAAAANADLTIETEPPARVGTGPLPFENDQTPSAMVVVGDAVYISRKGVLNNDNSNGIFFSQAIFDQTGKIIRWTPWSKRAFPTTSNAGVSLFAVDPNVGNIWALDEDNEQTIHVTAWDIGGIPNGLTAQVNKAMLHGCCSVLDLDQSTRGFTGTDKTEHRYALFGGANQVTFTRISQANDPDPTLQTPQTVITDFSLHQNLLQTFLPGISGSVRVLEYSRQNGGMNNNYFFAGTDKGLYVFTDAAGNGFDEETLSTLDVAPFINRSWQKITTIDGAILDIKTSGNSLYVLAFTSTPTQPFNTTLYRIPFATTTTAMFALPLTVIAQSNTAPVFTNTAYFTSIEIISTNGLGTTEQLVLGTNTGLYRSSRAGGVQAATSQTNAAWVEIDSAFYTDIAGMDNAWHAIYPGPTDVTSRATVWPISLQDQNNLNTLERSSIHQLNGTTDAGPFNFVPEDFNSSQSNNPQFTTLPKIYRFWSDGARRFFIITLPQDPSNRNRLMVLPYDTFITQVTTPNNQLLLTGILPLVNTFHWVQAIGMSGIVLAGTNAGVIALE